MRNVQKFLAVMIFSTLLFLPAVLCQKVSSQTGNEPPDEISEEKKWLTGDIRLADVVVYVDVKDAAISDRTSPNLDCENSRGGYCSYLLRAEIKEFFKGKFEAKMLNFYASAEAPYPSKNFLGERIVFLIWNETETGSRTGLGTIENSTRGTDAIEKIRNIVNPQSPIDDADESEPYSAAAIKKEFERADAVIYADAIGFKPDKQNDFGSLPFVFESKIKEVFKGSFKAGQRFKYDDDFTDRPPRKTDLGAQIIFLEKINDDGKVFYKRINYTVSGVQHDILVKLRKIAKQKSNRKQ